MLKKLIFENNSRSVLKIASTSISTFSIISVSMLAKISLISSYLP